MTALAEALRRTAAEERSRADLWRSCIPWRTRGGRRYLEGRAREHDGLADIYERWAAVLAARDGSTP
jgi:hypothetical protein